MPSRADLLCVPERLADRPAWIDENLPRLLAGIPLSRASVGWGAIVELERCLFPRLASDYLGGELDPACPVCGLETDEGTVARDGDGFLVSYGCHTVVISEAELRARVKRAGDA